MYHTSYIYAIGYAKHVPISMICFQIRYVVVGSFSFHEVVLCGIGHEDFLQFALVKKITKSGPLTEHIIEE